MTHLRQLLDDAPDRGRALRREVERWSELPSDLWAAEHRALNAALGVLEGSESAVVDRLRRRLLDQTKSRKLWDAAAEVGVAAWASTLGQLDEGRCGNSDPVLDLAVQLPTRRLHLEVKRDHAPIEHEIIYGQHEHDRLALGPFLREKYPSCLFAVEWQGRRPGAAEWGPMRATIHDRAVRAIAESELQPMMGRELRIFVEFKGTPGFRFTIRVSLGFAIGINLSVAGEEWGCAADLVIRHAVHKAKLSETDFVLVYFSLSGEQPTVTAERMAWAWAEITQEAPKKLLGVVILRQHPSERAEFSASGLFREESWSILDDLQCRPVPPTWEPIRSDAAWNRLRREIGAAATKHDLAELADLAQEMGEVACDAPGSGDLYARVVVAAADNGVKVRRVALPPGRGLPFPSAPEAMLHPDPIPTRRR